MKEHFLAFMKAQHPDRHADLARRYARAAYLPVAEQEAIAQRVHAVVTPERRRRTRADTFGHPDSSAPGSATEPAGAGTAVEQLPLLPAAGHTSMSRPWR